VEAARGNTEENILKDVAQLKTRFVESLDKVQDSLMTEYKKLSDIQAAITIEKKNLDDLYALKVNADSLAAILLSQKESKEKFEAEMKTVREKFDLDIAETKARWEKEKKEVAEKMKEEQTQLQKTKKREEEEYLYHINLTRKKEADEYALKKSQLDAELKDKKVRFDKEFAEREKTIIEKEKELSELRKLADNMPKEI